MTQHLTKASWDKANRNYIAKSICELMHEQLLQPTEIATNGDRVSFVLKTSVAGISYSFDASHRAMDYWHIYRETLKKEIHGEVKEAADAVAFFLEMAESFGVQPFTLTHFVEETNNTLYADAFMIDRGRPSAESLAEADYQTLEHTMDGHPWATVNKGRIGFSASDYAKYAPETKQSTQLNWIAVHNSRAEFTAMDSISHHSFLKAEIGETQFNGFVQKLLANGYSATEYFFMPVHDWQWSEKVCQQFAHDIANGLIIELGRGEDVYKCQQSIRTFFNVSHPEKHYVKTAISILNTSVFRGLSSKKLAIAPRVTQWAKDKLKNDEYLKSTGVTLLGEVASVGYTHPHYSQIEKSPYQYQELLGVIWRESADPYLKEGERLATMASMFYVDDNGKSLIGAWIDKSGISAKDWVKTYLKAYFKPVLHIFYKHSFFFSPHGENTILVLKDHVPHRIIIKDFVEEIVLTPKAKSEVSPEMQEILREIDNEYALLFILSGVFDGVFRYISNVLHTFTDYPETLFWKQVADVIEEYQKENPDLTDQFKEFDLFTPEFIRVCINRVRLLTYGYGESTDIPMPEVHGMLSNPVSKFATVEI